MPDDILTATATGVTISVWVVPGSSRAVIDGRHGDSLKVRVTSPAQGGRANDEIGELLGGVLGANVTLKKGMRGRSKVFEVFQTDIETVRRQLGL